MAVELDAGITPKNLDAKNAPKKLDVEIASKEGDAAANNASGEVDVAIASEELDPVIAQLLEAQATFEVDDQHRRPKIQRIPVLLRQNPNFVKYCSPKMISFGPIHQRNRDLKLGQQLKRLWASLYIKRFARYQDGGCKEVAARFLHQSIKEKLRELKCLFCEDVIESYNDEELARMLLVDGCALLYFMEHFSDRHPELLKLKLDQLMYIWRDIILLENQLPTLLMEILCERGENYLEYLWYNFLFRNLEKKCRSASISIDHHQHRPAHLLHYIRSFYTLIYESQGEVKCSRSQYEFNEETFLSLREADSWHRYKNIRDLRKAGIRVQANKTGWKWNNVSFTSKWFSGQLMLPGIVIDDVTPYFYHNLIAYEMCPDFLNDFEFCSYFSLMDSFIDDAEDVKELRSAGVLRNFLGNDEEVAKLFNELGHELPAKMFNTIRIDGAVAYSNRYIEVKHQIDKHYRNKWKTWLAQLRTTYFNSPWSHITFLAAVLALVLTSIQTWYAVHPKN